MNTQCIKVFFLLDDIYVWSLTKLLEIDNHISNFVKLNHNKLLKFVQPSLKSHVFRSYRETARSGIININEHLPGKSKFVWNSTMQFTGTEEYMPSLVSLPKNFENKQKTVNCYV